MPADLVVRVAMWSGPRNISTALMRAFENRADCAVVDEPFYGYYLKSTGVDHPGRKQIIESMNCDWRAVAQSLASDVPDGCRVFYQKLMTHHMLEEVELDFARHMVNCLLIRDPARMIASYARIRPEFDLIDLGLPQQVRIARILKDLTDQSPYVLEAEAVLRSPQQALAALCSHCGIEMTHAMLEWPPGGRASDGVWAPYWYDAVYSSTGFNPPPEEYVSVPERYEGMLQEAQRLFGILKADRG